MKPPIGISEAADEQEDIRWHFLRGFNPRVEGRKIENLTGFPRLRVERTLLNLTGAICEYRDRKVKSCAPNWRKL